MIDEILSRCDHTLLKITATEGEILALVDEGAEYKTASVCIPPAFVEVAARYAAGRVKICTVIGFPNGYSTTAVKAFEAAEAVRLGADEVDMVINLGMVRSGRFSDILGEINAVKDACAGRVLKVIIETSELTECEIRTLCRVVSDSRADYIKTSTGFTSRGASFSDIEIMRDEVSERLKIKASGGISSIADAEKFIALGADRLGTSRMVKLARELKKDQNGVAKNG